MKRRPAIGALSVGVAGILLGITLLVFTGPPFGSHPAYAGAMLAFGAASVIAAFLRVKSERNEKDESD